MIDTDAPQHGGRQGDGRHADLLVGRVAEVDRIRAFVATARSDGGALLVTGEPGVGKTGLLDAAADIALAGGTRVLRAAGIQFEAEMSYAGLNQVLLPLMGGLPQLAAVHRDALNVSLGFGEGVPPSRLVVSNAALMLLREAAEARPLLVILDDLPWLDRASAAVLSFVARRLEGTQVGLLTAARTGEDDVFDHAGVPELMVKPLDGSASRQLLETRCPDLGPAARDRILLEAQGNPLALVELPVGLGPGTRAAASALPLTLPLGGRLQTLFGSQIRRLPRPTRRLLLRIALDGTGDVRVLEAEGDSGAGARDLAAAEEARVAYLDDATHRLAFRHPLLRSTVVELSRPEDRRTAHRALADVWADQPDRRAWHLAEATLGADESVAADLEAAAARILARGDAVGCVKALTRASQLSPRNADRQRRVAAAAYIGAEVAGDLGNAALVLADLRRGDTEIEGSLQAAIAASSFLLQGDGDVATAHGLLVGALDSRDGLIDARDPVLAEALHSLMIVCAYGGSEDFWEPFEAALARSEGVPSALALSRFTFADPARSGAALGALDRAISALADEADPTQIVRIGIAASYVNRLEGCRAPLLRLIRDARQGGAVASGITARIILARDDLDAGRWDEVDELIDEAVEVCESLGYRNAAWPGWHLQAVVAAARGDNARTRELTDGLLQWGGPRGIRAVRWWAARVRARLALGQGDFELGYQMASSVSPAGVIAPHSPTALDVLMDLVEAALRTGRDADAKAHVAAMHETDLESISSRLALIVGGCSAMTAARDSGLAIFRETLALPGVERWQFDYARVQLAYGERLRRNREMVESRIQLNAALAIFERLGARPWVDRTTTELRATGQTKPHAGDNVLDRLTPQEFEIATLAASGLTNKQIAERLFLSHRTVGGHLHRAFPKLGVSARAALRDALQSLSPEQRPLN
jgi:DNA-binding CsgD family transcriptional regulator